MNFLLFCFLFSLNLRMIDKKEVYKNLIKELIKLFDGHILLYILQSLSSMFANIEMCCCIEGILILWILQFKTSCIEGDTVKSAPNVASVYNNM